MPIRTTAAVAMIWLRTRLGVLIRRKTRLVFICLAVHHHPNGLACQWRNRRAAKCEIGAARALSRKETRDLPERRESPGDGDMAVNVGTHDFIGRQSQRSAQLPADRLASVDFDRRFFRPRSNSQVSVG